MESPRCVLTVSSPAAGRGPVRVGVPWPRGVVTDAARLALTDASGRAVPVQAKVTDRWADGSARWVLLDWIAEAGAGPYTVALGATAAPSQPLRVADVLWPLVETGAAGFMVQRRAQDIFGVFPFYAWLTGHDPEVARYQAGLRATDSTGRDLDAAPLAAYVDEEGPIRAVVVTSGCVRRPAEVPLADIEARLHFFAGLSVVRVEFTLRNPRRAEHPGGLWDLGDPGSVLPKDASFTSRAADRPVGRAESSRPDVGSQPATTPALTRPASSLEDSARPTTDTIRCSRARRPGSRRTPCRSSCSRRPAAATTGTAATTSTAPAR